MVEAFVELAGKRPRYLFLDEVQKVGDYGGWLRRRLNAYVYLSGSTSELTPRRVEDEMRGRSVGYEVYPLSFREFLRFKGVKLGRYLGYTEERGKVLSLLREYLQYGAYPAAALSGDRKRLLRSYFDLVVVRDLSIVKPEVAEYFADSLVCGYSSLISMNKVYGDLRSSFRVGKETVSSLFDRAEETYFAFFVEIFDKSLRRRRMNPKKLYIIDTGYVRVRGCEYSISKAMENAVYLELKRRDMGDIYYLEGIREEGREGGGLRRRQELQPAGAHSSDLRRGQGLKERGRGPKEGEGGTESQEVYSNYLGLRRRGGRHQVHPPLEVAPRIGAVSAVRQEQGKQAPFTSSSNNHRHASSRSQPTLRRRTARKIAPFRLSVKSAKHF